MFTSLGLAMICISIKFIHTFADVLTHVTKYVHMYVHVHVCIYVYISKKIEDILTKSRVKYCDTEVSTYGNEHFGFVFFPPVNLALINL